jgi:hypothetical protein
MYRAADRVRFTRAMVSGRRFNDHAKAGHGRREKDKRTLGKLFQIINANDRGNQGGVLENRLATAIEIAHNERLIHYPPNGRLRFCFLWRIGALSSGLFWEAAPCSLRIGSAQASAKLCN